MATDSENYLAKADELDAKAASTKIASARETYVSLARSYRELAARKMRKAQEDAARKMRKAQEDDAEAEALAKRIIGRD